MNNLTTLFLSQSYQDTWDDYLRSLKSSRFAAWDYVILTASNEKQAESFRMQLEQRRQAAFLPERTHFAVIPDEGGVRVGSGGATLSVIDYIARQQGSGDFSGLRILVIHSGGDSKRVPQYSALGKLFSPVPRVLPNGRTSTLFDECMISMSSMAGRISAGMLLLSGDVLLLFNPLQVDYSGVGAAAISFKEAVETGRNHGVFLGDENGSVRRFLHKQSVESLRKFGAVNEQNAVDIDTGAVIFSADMLRSLFSLISTEGKRDEAKYRAYVNDRVRLSLYGDFLYPLAEDSTLEAFYQEKPEGEFCDALLWARRQVWEVLRPYRMKLLRLAPAKFVHFGTTGEILKLMGGGVEAYADLGWSRQVGSSISGNTAGWGSVLSKKAQIGDNCYLGVSYVHSDAKIGSNVLLSYIDIHDETVPDNVVLHGLKQRNGKFVVRIYGIHDNPKEAQLFGKPLAELVRLWGIAPEQLWQGSTRTLWTADLYPQCDSVPEAVAAALNLYELAHGAGDLQAWLSANRKSLCSGFNDADPYAMIAWDSRMNQLVCADTLSKLIQQGVPAGAVRKELLREKLTPIQEQWLEKRLSRADFSEKLRLYWYLGTVLGGSEGERYTAKCFDTLQQTVLTQAQQMLSYHDSCRMVCREHAVQLPLRVNWGGGWSDTPPYCLERGGTVLNAAILLDGQRPVEVRLEQIPEHKIVFDSRDMDVHGEFHTIEPLQRSGDPYDPFALQKACLLACGILPKEGGDLDAILTRLGGGFVMHSEVTNVPKGSGLGTSSILSAACVKAVLEFMGIPYTDAELYSRVLCMEQLMSTGGGWQDQVGGVTDGIKYITSRPGLDQQLRVQTVTLDPSTAAELNNRFCLIYTGQRRLARNLLRDVVGRYVGGEPESVEALDQIQKLAALMRFELERGNVDAFACLLNRHWELSKQIDAGSTNTLIDQIFASIEDLIDGKMICGAGGGGFLQVILKRGVDKQTVHNRLKEMFADNPIDVWNCTLI